MGNREEAQRHFERGINLYRIDRFNDAIAEFTEAIKLHPNGAGIYGNRGAAYGQQGKYSEAIADFETQLKLDPGNVECRDNIAKTKRVRGW
jgi:tetratricopeptide (TPR) repeat protein